MRSTASWLQPDRWNAFRTPRARTVAWAIAATLLTITAIGWLVALVSAFDWFGRSFAIDFGIYQDALARWSSGGSWYQERQLSGPYPIELGDVLYPPVLIYLLSPFRMLGPWLWTIIPTLVIVWVVWRHRPGPWAWVLIAACVAWPYSPAKYVYGNPVIWATAAVGLGTIWWWPSALAVLKPTIIPFALIGVRDRRWWLVIGVLALASLPFLADDADSTRGSSSTRSRTRWTGAVDRSTRSRSSRYWRSRSSPGSAGRGGIGRTIG